MLNFLFDQLYNFLQFIINFLPSGSPFPEQVHSAFATLGSYLGLIDVFIPISTMLWCLLLVFGVQIAIFGFKTIKWIISFIPLIGGKGNQ